MSPPKIRRPGFVPTRFIERALRFVKPPEVSQRRLEQFLAEMNRRPPVTLPHEAPSSLAVVVPCFGHAAYLPEMFESILAQTRRPDEAILVDDRSPDATAEVLQTLVAAHPEAAVGRVSVLLNDRNIGQAASLNRGIATASSEVIMVLNDDDYLMHDAVESMLAFFSQYRDAALIGAHSIHFTGHGSLAAVPKLSTAYAPSGLPLIVHRPEDVPGYRHYNDLNMSHSGSCFRKVAWESVGGYCVDREQRIVPFSDRDFQLRVNAIWPVAVADRTPFSFWRADSSVDGGRNS